MLDDKVNKQIKNWEDQLLDLGKRNRMISFRTTRRSTLNILTPTMEELYRQVVVQDRELQFQRPITRDSEPRMFAALTLMDALASPMEVCVGDIRAEGDLADHGRTLRNLRSRAKLAMDEQGANILYLVFGFIEWKEKTSRQDSWLRSPLLLAPVSLSQAAINAPYCLKRRDDEVVVNPTLRYLFSRDYGVELPEFDDDKDDLEEFFRKMEDIAEAKGWRVLRQSSLGLVSFQKISMYNDLVRNEEPIRRNPIIRALAGEENSVTNPQLDEKAFDHDAIPSAQYHQVLSADSSQQDAIALSRMGVSFVLQGPPGTGKSQTIANIIAQGIADGKKTLFVSEKMAALDVVHKRLSDVNLAEFCLPMHSRKANKRDILRQLENSLDLKHLRVAEETLMCYPRLDTVAGELRTYVTELHTPRSPLNISIYDACGALAKRQDLPDILDEFPGAEQLSREQLESLSLKLQKLDRSRRALKGNWRTHPWDGFTGGYLQPSEKKERKDQLDRLILGLAGLEEIRLETCSLAEAVNLKHLEDFTALLEAACDCQPLLRNWLFRDSTEPEKLLSARMEAARALEVENDQLKSFCTGELPETGMENAAQRLEEALDTISALNGKPMDVCYGELARYSEKLDTIMQMRTWLEGFRENFLRRYQLTGTEGLPEELGKLCILARDAGALEESYFDDGHFRQIQEVYGKLSEASREYQLSRDILSGRYGTEIVNLENPEARLKELENLAERFIWLLPESGQSLDRVQAIAGVRREELAQLDILRDETPWEYGAFFLGAGEPVTFREAYRRSALLREIAYGSGTELWYTEQGRKTAKRMLDSALDQAENWEAARERIRDASEKLGMKNPGEAITQDAFFRLQSLAELPEDAASLLKAVTASDGWRVLEQTESLLADLKEDEVNLQTLLMDGDVIDLDRLRRNHWKEYSAAAAAEPKSCWANNRRRAYEIVAEAEKAAEALKEKKHRILTICEPDVFRLDYMSILNRFKTEYTGIFRHLMPQYRRDMNRLRLVFRDVRRRIPEDEIIGLLMELRNYHEALEQYTAIGPRLRNWFALDRYDMDFDWSVLRERLDQFYRFAEIFRTEQAAAAFVNDGNWAAVDRILHRREKYASELEENPRAAQLFASRYQGIHTDTAALRRDMEKIRSGMELFAHPDDCLRFLLEGRENSHFSALRDNYVQILAREKWYRENQAELIRAAGPDHRFDGGYLRSKIDLLKRYGDAAALFGEDALQQMVSRKGRFFESSSAVMAALERLEKLLVHLSGGPLADEILDKRASAIIKNVSEAVASAQEWLGGSNVVTGCLKMPAEKNRLTVTQIHDAIGTVMRLNQSREVLDAYAPQAEQLFAADFVGRDTDWERIGKKVRLRLMLETLIPGGIPERLREVIRRGGELLPRDVMAELRGCLQTIHEAQSTLWGAEAKTTVREAVERERLLRESIRNAQNLSQSAARMAGRALDYSGVTGILDALARRDGRCRELADCEDSLRASLPELPKDIPWEQAEQMFVRLKALKQILFSGKLDYRVTDWILAGVDSLDIQKTADRVRLARDGMADIDGFYASFAGAENRKALSVAAILQHLRGCAETFGDLDSWADLHGVEEECTAQGLGQFVGESGTCDYTDGTLMDCFLKLFYRSWLDGVSRGLETIERFRSHAQDQTVEDFRRLDEHQLPVDQLRIREKLTRNMPRRTDQPRAADEMSILLHELGKKRNIMALRKLFRAIPNLLLRLKPCLMMSPLSVAHFLEGDTYRFDMVIFDEASQIFPQDAVGAIFRGKQVIIAGDSNQLPPTNFFSASTSNNWDGEEEEEEQPCFDSILEAAAGMLPNRSLLWHYRSRYEALIAFSNREIYGNHLITFPSSTIGQPDTGVEYIYVENGVYENRSNRAEALRIVQLVEEHILRRDGRSLGIIAFSEAQQNMIEDEIHKFRIRNPGYEWFFDENAEEPFFVKNLENVQGDERDTILFSICYGRNSQGRMYMRFGPLGMEGGERRLNVAITRAKRNIKLVGSIMPEDIDLRKTQAEGVRLLRDYISFARNSGRLEPSVRESDHQNPDLFAEQVARFLEKQGCKVCRNLGSSDYTVDIAVEHPGKPGCYLAGIECDGYVYSRARTVRDRDHLRPGVMKTMGWNLYRIWSVAWMSNPQAEQQKLMEFLQNALLGKNPEKTADAPQGEMTAIQFCEEEKTGNHVPADLENPYDLPLYVPCDWQTVEVADCYTEDQKIQRRIMAVLQTEQPIHLELLCRRLAESLGASKATVNVRETILAVLQGPLADKVAVEDEFVRFAAAECTVRRSELGQPHRGIEHISVAEIAGAMERILQGSFGMERSVLCLETAKVFGYERMGSKIRQRTALALEDLLRRGKISLTDDKVQLLEV